MGCFPEKKSTLAELDMFCCYSTAGFAVVHCSIASRCLQLSCSVAHFLIRESSVCFGGRPLALSCLSSILICTSLQYDAHELADRKKRAVNQHVTLVLFGALSLQVYLVHDLRSGLCKSFRFESWMLSRVMLLASCSPSYCMLCLYASPNIYCSAVSFTYSIP